MDESADDAYLKMLAGASILQLYTGLIFKGPDLINKIVKELDNKSNMNNISNIIGSKAYEIANGHFINE